MIVQMKKGSTKKEYEKLVHYLQEKKLEIIDASSDEMRVFGIIGDTSSLDPSDLYAFEGVKEVTRVSTPFKKASRSFKKSDTVIKLSDEVVIGGDQFVVMAGPCSVESEEQLRTIAKSVKKSGAHLLR
ncbi:MAG TPA: 3-deoxy-7-phosphoheptulonate synthase, partial [Acholeplasmataceae bacterium]|nr:3-deoxy-7-phosphoheptulonate synthase [Acholeplasmataceae bacterium]